MSLNSVKKNPLLLLLLFILTKTSVFAESTALPFQGQINSNSINVRCDSSVSSEIIYEIEKGEIVDVISELYDWYKIRLPKAAPSYVKKDLFECIKLALVNQECLSAKAIKDRINVRLHPNESSAIIGMIFKSEVIKVIGNVDAWYKIEPVNNSFGWVHKRFVNKVSGDKAQPQDLVDIQDREKNIIIEGIVKPYGKLFGSPATHKLITDGGEIFFLRGDKKTLNALTHRRVKITGERKSWPKQKYPVVEIKVMEVAD